MSPYSLYKQTFSSCKAVDQHWCPEVTLIMKTKTGFSFSSL